MRGTIVTARTANFRRGAAMGGLALACSLVFTTSGPIARSAHAEETATGQLVVVFSGLENDRGTAGIALMNSADHFENDAEAFRSATPPVKDGTATATFHDLPYGRYAIKIYHDENANGKLDTNFVGYPKESFGFSNDAMGRFGPPSFDEASFEIAGPTLRIVISAK
jgi:uncharacterized protein (DUF2141 family)